MRRRRFRPGRDDVRDGVAERDRTPRAVADGRQSVLPARLPVVGAERADTPAHRPGPARRAVKGVELALVQHVRVDDLGLVCVDEPDLVTVRSLDRRPAQKAGLARERCRRRGRFHVEAVRLAPRRGGGTLDRAHACEERVRIAGYPRQRHVWGRDGARQSGCRVDDAALTEARAGRELELVPHRSGDRVPREGGRPGEGILRRFVGAQQEAVQARRSRAADRRRRARRRGEREQAETDGRKCEDTHGSRWLSACPGYRLSLERGTAMRPAARRRGTRRPRGRRRPHPDLLPAGSKRAVRPLPPRREERAPATRAC